MKKTIYVCDICQREFDNDINMFTLKYENNSKVNTGKMLKNEYYNDFPNSVEKWDICYNCLQEIRTKIRGF